MRQRRAHDAARSGEKFVRNELMPWRRTSSPASSSGSQPHLATRRIRSSQQCQELGLWALDVPEEAGGANLPAVALVGVNEDLGQRRCRQLPPDFTNLHMMWRRYARAAKKYLDPYAAGRRPRHRHFRARRGRRSRWHETRAVKDGDIC